MPIQMSLWEKGIWNYTNQAPAIVIDFFSALGFRVVDAAINLNLFEALHKDGPQTVQQLAQKISASKQGITLMVEALESLGYVKKVSDSYMNSPLTTKWLLSDSPDSIKKGLVLYKKLLFERLNSLEKTIKEGKPQTPFWEWFDQMPNGWTIFQEGMVAGAKMAANELAKKLTFPQSPHHILDIGGGHGLYSIKVCEVNPKLQSTIFDIPQSIPFGKEMVQQHQLTKRIRFQEGDLEKGPFPKGFDTVFLFSIIHGYHEEFLVDLFQKVHSILNPSGRVIILDLLVDRPKGSFNQAMAKLMALNLFNDVGGEIHSLVNLKKWLKTAGFGKLHHKKLLKSPFTMIEAYSVIA